MPKLLTNYTTGINCADSIEKLGTNPTDEEIRRYFLVDHNKKHFYQISQSKEMGTASQQIHLAIPYKKSTGEVYQFFPKVIPFLQKINTEQRLKISEEAGIILPRTLDEILITHVGLIVDTMPIRELNKYLLDLNKK
jgi:hypothetical protein